MKEYKFGYKLIAPSHASSPTLNAATELIISAAEHFSLPTNRSSGGVARQKTVSNEKVIRIRNSSSSLPNFSALLMFEY